MYASWNMHEQYTSDLQNAMLYPGVETAKIDLDGLPTPENHGDPEILPVIFEMKIVFAH